MTDDLAGFAATTDAADLRALFFDAFEELTRSLGTWSVRSDDRIEIQAHRHPVSIVASPLPSAERGVTLAATSTIRLARGVDDDRYLPLLARHARRSDPLGMLVLEGGELTSVRNLRVHARPEAEIDVAEPVDAVTIQALQAELLVDEATDDGLLEPCHRLPFERPGPDVQNRTRPEEGRPNALFDVGHRIAHEGVRRMATINLTCASQLGPWFVGTEQDALLTERIAAGWLRRPDPHRHAVVVEAPADEPALDAIEVRWAHVSSLMGPCVLLAGRTRTRLGSRASRRLQAMNRPGAVPTGRGRAGLWLPESWLDDATLASWANRPWRPDEPSPKPLDDDRAVWVTVAPTAWARPGALARYWTWAEHEAKRTLRPAALN